MYCQEVRPPKSKLLPHRQANRLYVSFAANQVRLVTAAYRRTCLPAGRFSVAPRPRGRQTRTAPLTLSLIHNSEEETAARPQRARTGASAPETQVRGSSAPKSSGRRRRRCAHHWVIEMPHGVTSKGQCKRCGRMRRFRSAEPPKTLGNYLRRSKGSS